MSWRAVTACGWSTRSATLSRPEPARRAPPPACTCACAGLKTTRWAHRCSSQPRRGWWAPHKSASKDAALATALPADRQAESQLAGSGHRVVRGRLPDLAGGGEGLLDVAADWHDLVQAGE